MIADRLTKPSASDHCLHRITNSSPSVSSDQSCSTSRERGRLGKYPRAKGRRGVGRPAVWKPRLLLEGEGLEGKGDEDDEEAREAGEGMSRRYGRKQLGSNADMYVEEELVLNSEGACLGSTPIPM